MKFETLITHFGSQSEAARKLQLTPQAVSLWKKTGIVPRPKAFLAELVTGGKIKIDESCYAPDGSVLGTAQQGASA
jgi:DNA-binding transcriptional regulator Cro